MYIITKGLLNIYGVFNEWLSTITSLRQTRSDYILYNKRTGQYEVARVTLLHIARYGTNI